MTFFSSSNKQIVILYIENPLRTGEGWGGVTDERELESVHVGYLQSGCV